MLGSEGRARRGVRLRKGSRQPGMLSTPTATAAATAAPVVSTSVDVPLYTGQGRGLLHVLLLLVLKIEIPSFIWFPSSPRVPQTE